MVNFIESLRMLALKMALQFSSDSVYEDSFALLTGWSINYLLGFWMRDLDCYVTTRIEFWHLQKKIWLTATAETKKSNISSEPHLLFLSSKSINWSQYLGIWYIDMNFDSSSPFYQDACEFRDSYLDYIQDVWIK